MDERALIERFQDFLDYQEGLVGEHALCEDAMALCADAVFQPFDDWNDTMEYFSQRIRDHYAKTWLNPPVFDSGDAETDRMQAELWYVAIYTKHEAVINAFVANLCQEDEVKNDPRMIEWLDWPEPD